MKEFGVVYLVTNLVNGKKYVGQTVTGVEKRWNDHVSGAYKKTPRFSLQRAIVKYGRESFTVDIIAADVPREQLNLVERVWIKVYDSMHRSKGYNMLPGGTIVMTEETRAKLSASLKGRVSPRKGVKLPAEQIEKMRLSKLGVKASEDTKAKMSASHCRRIAAQPGLYRKTDEQKERIRQTNTGKTHSEATKAKMSAAKIGKPKSEETKARMREAWKHRAPRKPPTPEQIERSRQGVIAAWAKRKAASREEVGVLSQSA
jgi:group I intron endonuclease